MTAKEALFAEMGWAEDAKDAPGQMPLPGFENTIKNWGQKSKGRKKGIGAAAVGGGVGASSPAGSPQSELEAHDKKNHPDGYKGGRCKLRGELASKGFDVRGYDAKVHNFTAPEGYDYNVDDKKGDGEKESGEGRAAIGEQVGEEQKSEEGEKTLQEPEKVDIGGTEITAMTEDGKKIADLLARLDKEPEKVIAEYEEFAGLNPDEVKEKLQDALKKLSENPATNADAKTQAQQQAAQQEQNQAQQAQHEQAIAAGNELNAEVSSEAGQLDLLTKNHEQAVADIAQQIKALNGKEPETTALKNELVKENKKFEKEFQKIDPVAQNEDGTPESPDDHAKHCKANPKSNCPFLKGAMTPEQLQQLDAQSAQEAQQAGTEGGQVVPAEGKVVPQGGGQNSQESAGEGNAQGEQGGGEGDFSHLKGAVTDEQYEQVKKSPQWEQFRKMLVDYLSKGGDVDVSDTTKFPPNGIFMRTFNEVVAGLKFQGRKVEEWSENDVVDVPAEGSSNNPEAQKNQEQIGNQEQQTNKKSDFQNLGENPLGEEQGGEGDADDLDFDDDGDVEPEQPPPTDGTPSPEQGAGQEPPNGQQPQQPFVDNGRRPGLMHKRDWTPAQRAALQELAKRFGAAAEGFRSGVNDENFNRLLNDISHFSTVKNKWDSTPNVSEARQVPREALASVMEEHVQKSHSDILYEQLNDIMNDKTVSEVAKSKLERLIPWLKNPDLTNMTRDRILDRIGKIVKEYDLEDKLKRSGKSDGSDIVDGYLEDGDENHKNGGVVSSADEYLEWDAKLDDLSGQEDTNGKVNNPDEIKDKIINDLSAHKFPISPDDITETNNISTTDFTFKFPKDRKVTKGLISALKQEIARNFPLDENKGLSINYNERNDTLVVTVENDVKGNISQKTLLKSPEFQAAIERGDIPIALGIDEKGKPIIGNLTDYVHVLLAGQTGAGKSARLGSIVSSLLAQSPDNVRLMVVDPKRVEFSFLKGDPHLIGDVVTESSDAVDRLKYLVNEQENRYRLFEKAGVRNLKEYNDLVKQGKLPEGLPKKLPAISLVIDEFGDLMDTNGKDIEKLVKRLGQKSRAAGVHLVLATQRPTADSIPTSLRANLPTTIGMNVKNAAEARYVGIEGLEGLPQKGPLLIKTPDGKTTRVDGSYIDLNGLETIVKNGKGNPKSAPTEGGEGSPSGAEGAEGAAPAGETTTPTQSPDQIIDGLAKTPKGKAGLKAIADRLTQGNLKPITVGEKVADMTKKLLDGMGFGYTEMKGADGKVTISPKPKEQSTAETNAVTSETTSEVKEEKSASETKAEENKADTSSTEEVKKEESNQNPEREAERNSIDESLRDEYDAYHKDFEEAVAKARKTLEQKKAQGKAKSTDYANAHAEEQSAIGTLNLWREQNGLPKVTGFDKNGKPVFEKPAETDESAPEEASGAEAQGAEPAKEVTEAKGENMFSDPDGVGGVSNEFKRDSLEVNASKLNDAYQAYKNAKPGTKEWEAAKKDFAKVLKEDNALRKELGLNPRNENGRVVRAVNAPPPKEEANTAEAPTDTEPTGEEEPSIETPAETEENPYLDSAELEGMSEGYDKDELQDNAAELHEAQKQYEQSKQGSAERRKARDNIRKILKRDNAIRARLGMNQRGDNGHIVKPAEEGSAAKTDKEKATAQAPAENPYLDKAEIDGVDDEFTKADLEDGARRLNNAMNQWREARKSDPDSDETQQAREAFSAALEKDNALRKELGLPERDKNGKLPQAQNATAQEPEKKAEPAPATPQEKKNPENPDGTEPPADDNPPDDGGGDNGGDDGGGSGGGGAGGSTGGATNEPAPAAEPEKPVAKVESPAEEPKAPTDEEVDAQVNSDANIKALEKQVQSAKTTKDKRAAQSRLNQAKKSLGAAIRTAATKESGVRDVRTKKPTPQKPSKTTTATTKEKVPSKPEPKPVASKEPEKKQAATNKPEKKAAPSTPSAPAKEPPKTTKEGTSVSSKVNKPEKKPAQKPVKKPEAKQEMPKKEEAAKSASTTTATTTTGKESPKTSTQQKAEGKAPAKSRADNIKTAAEIYARNMNLPNAAQHPMNVNMANELVTAIEKKDPKVLLSKLGQGNEMSREAFEKITGTKLPYSPKELKKVIENYCGSEIGSEKPAQKPQAQGAKPAEAPKKETPAQAPAAKKTEEGEKKSDNNGMTPEYADYLKRKEAREKAEAEKQAKIKAEREERLRQAQMGRRDNSRGLNNQSQQFEVEAMKKTDPTKSENFKAISELKPPEKIDNESANALNEQFDKVSAEIAKLEGELKRNEEEGTLKPAEIQERVGMIGHLRQGLSDVFNKRKLGQGNFTFAKKVDGSGNINGLRISSYKGADGKMSAVKPIEKKSATTAANSQKSASQKQGTDTKKEEKSTSAKPAPKATQQEISFGDEGDKRSKEQQSIRDRVAALRNKRNKKGATAKDEAIAEDGGIWIPVLDEETDGTSAWTEIFDAAMFSMGGLGDDN